VKRAAAIALALLAWSSAASAGTATRETIGERTVRVYVPSKQAEPRALVLMLHGCTQDADGFAGATRMDEVAEENGFVVAYPEQTSQQALNACWQWWDPAHQKRDAGEPKELAAIADAVAQAHGADRDHVYVAGISAGGAMTVVLGATYPDRFAAIGVVAGLEYRAASSLSGVYSASSGGGPDPEKQGQLALEAMGSAKRVVPVMVIHGDADGVVAPVNGDQVTAQWRRTNTLILGEGAIGEPTIENGTAGYPFTREVHASTKTKASIVEHIVVSGLGHAWPGGREGGSFADAKGPDASRTLWAFFSARTLAAPIPDGPTAPPSTGETPSEPAAAPGATASDGGSGGGCAQGGRRAGGVWLVALFAACAALVRRRRHFFV
jgi:poly(hydroxyalkanoate) depolymerase family esterase